MSPTPDPPGFISIDNCTQNQPPRPAVYAGDFVALNSPNAVSMDVDAVVRPGLLCAKCQTIRTWLETNYLASSTHRQHEIELQHHATGLELERYYFEGCHLCTLIWHAFIGPRWSKLGDRSAHISQQLEQVRRGKDGMIILTVWSDYYEMNPLLRAELTTEMGKFQSQSLMVRRWALDSKVSKQGDLHIGMSPLDQLSACANTISTASKPVLQISKRWLEQCVMTHENCRRSQRKVSATVLPKRLVDLGAVYTDNTIKVILVDESFSTTKYAALSYCWGTSPSMKLTSSTVETLKSGVGVHQFSKTIQEAIYVTRQLDLRWLWIDALCIIQDSVDDWTQEAAGMVDVYQNCFICIAATGAESAEEGLFAQRDPLLYQPCDMFRESQQSKISGFYIDSQCYGLASLPAFKICLEKSALHKRGWVMQERLLPPRTLNFGSIVFWECREQYQDEFCLSHKIREQTLKSEFSSLILQRTAHGQIPKEEGRKIRRLWEKILEQYTRAKLTVQSDKLIALSGVIRAIERSTGWRNIWGLWEPFLVTELLWKTGSVASPAIAAPSWSWTSVGSRVYFGTKGGVYGDGDRDVPLASLEDVISMDGPGSHPRIMLRISGLPVQLKRPVTSSDLETISMPLVDWPFFIGLTFDVRDGKRSAHVFLPLMKRMELDSDEIRCVSGLILSPSSTRPEAFERVGYGEHSFGGGASKMEFNMSPLGLSDPARRQIIELV